MNTPTNQHSQTNVLGQPVSYETTYSADVLYRIPRKSPISSVTPEIFGVDIWRSYEFSWLDPIGTSTAGRPRNGLLRIEFDSRSPYLVESKSLKLYLGSFAFYNGRSNEIKEIIQSDLAKLLESRPNVEITEISPTTASGTVQWGIHSIQGTLLDDLEISCDCYDVNPSLLQVDDTRTSFNGTVYSNLLRTLCPITSQPDWATVEIQYNGPLINRESLLKYLISFRNHPGFHEFCCEQIFSDIWQKCSPHELMVVCHFTRRGGIDITPVRASTEDTWNNRIRRTLRQ
jgi:7-cyano-7-deazaguanine reductase